MPRKTQAQEHAELVARIVYPESNLAARGVAMYEAWERQAEEEQENIETLWAQDWKRLLNAFNTTPNVLAHFNNLKIQDEEEPYTEEELEEEFEEGSDWALRFSGEIYGYTMRVWSYNPWDGELAYVLVYNEEEFATIPTNLG